MNVKTIMALTNSTVKHVRIFLETHTCDGNSFRDMLVGFDSCCWKEYVKSNVNLIIHSKVVSIGIDGDTLCLVIAFD